MRYLIYFSFVILIFSNCSSDGSMSEKELELKERELALKEKEMALNQLQNIEVSTPVNESPSTVSHNTSSAKSATKQNYAPKEKTEDQLKRELAQKEYENRKNYLSKSSQDLQGIYKNALSMKFKGFKLKFNIRNSAELMTFKNVRCRVVLSSNSGSTILAKNYTVAEFVRAGGSISYKGEFSCTNQQYKDTDKYFVEILDAECH